MVYGLIFIFLCMILFISVVTYYSPPPKIIIKIKKK